MPKRNNIIAYFALKIMSTHKVPITDGGISTNDKIFSSMYLVFLFIFNYFIPLAIFTVSQALHCLSGLASCLVA